jgi:hypothetical protein
MRSAKMLLSALGVEGAVLEDVRWEETAKAPRLVVSVRPLEGRAKAVLALRPAVPRVRPRRRPSNVACARLRPLRGAD